MPFINSKVNVKTTAEQQRELKEHLGQAIATITGQSESWIMVTHVDQRKTEELTQIYGEVRGVKPDHMHVKYAASMDWGWNGSNF